MLPPSPEAYIADFNTGLDSWDASIKEKKEARPLFAAVLHLAHGNIIGNMPLDVLDAYADALKAAGAERIDIYTTPAAWPDKTPAIIAKYDAVIAHIRQIGVKLGFDPTADVRPVEGGFAVWKPGAIAAYTEMARRYQPEKFSVLHEPTAMNSKLHDKVTPQQWADFSSEACASIAKVSPHTQCTVAVLLFERAEFDALVKAPGIQSIGFDIMGHGTDIIHYDNKGLIHQLAEIEHMVSAARAAGKSLHIAELGRQTWGYQGSRGSNGASGSTSSPYAPYDIGNARYLALDERYFTTMVHFAAAHHFDSVQLMRTTTFFTYAPPGTNPSLVSGDYIAAVAKAVAAKKRTGMFDTYRKIVGSFGH